MNEIKIFGNLDKARVLVIGHDPRLQESNTVAEYCFFADYFFKPVPTKSPELAKYKFAESLFCYITYLTSFKYSAEELIITNLCNKTLPRAPKGKTVLIPEEYAKEGLNSIKEIIQKSSQIEIIIAMSQQVNYWLQKLGFYYSTESYMKKLEPIIECAKKGYYKPMGQSPFLEICGKKYLVQEKIPLFPVLHVKQYPLKNSIKKNYEKSYNNCINSIKELLKVAK